jgi:hypothetical protein
LGYGVDYDNSVAYVSAWQPDGSQLNNNFPVRVTFQNSTDGRLNRNPVLVGDINGDGKKEIVAIEDLSPTTFTLAIFANDGTPLTWQVAELPGVPVVMAAADLDNNAKLADVSPCLSARRYRTSGLAPDTLQFQCRQPVLSRGG